jgi:tRNA(Arg) A34 adenosine deaminase TadA
MIKEATVNSLGVTDLNHLDIAIGLARTARNRGDHPFGAVVVTPTGDVVEGINTVVTQRDPTGHAETNAVRTAVLGLSPAALRGSTLYASTEPCAMCAATIFWAGIPRVVYALGSDELRRIIPQDHDTPSLGFTCREVFARGSRKVEVQGPFPSASASDVHEGFWSFSQLAG